MEKESIEKIKKLVCILLPDDLDLGIAKWKNIRHRVGCPDNKPPMFRFTTK
jgi:hypothetical protein